MNLLYDPPLFRPPSEGDNLIIQATLGCSFNQCSFCAMYRSKHYVERPLADVFADIRLAAADWPDAHRVFLADGDALALPTEHLLAILRELAAVLPRLTRVSCYATPGNLARKSAEELALLREHKLNLLYFGIESGSDLILKKITKGATQKRMAEVLHKAHSSGMKVSATVILGLGGTQHSDEHIAGTLAYSTAPPSPTSPPCNCIWTPASRKNSNTNSASPSKCRTTWRYCRNRKNSSAASTRRPRSSSAPTTPPMRWHSPGIYPRIKRNCCCNCGKRWPGTVRCGRYSCEDFEAEYQAESDRYIRHAMQKSNH